MGLKNTDSWWDRDDNGEWEITVTYSCTCGEYEKEEYCTHIDKILGPDTPWPEGAM